MSDLTRFSRHDPCNYCRCWDGKRHQGTRCWGGRYPDGTVLCTNNHVDHGDAKWSDSAQAWIHHPDDRATARPAPIATGRPPRTAPRKRADDWRFDVAYNYRREGPLRFQVCRRGRGAAKVIRQRQPDPAGGYWADLEGVELCLYDADKLLAAPKGSIIVVNEGEPAVEACRARGLLATCSPMGAGKWRDAYAEDLRDQIVIIVADHDEPGRKHAATVAASLTGIAARVYVIAFDELPEKADVVDYFEQGGTVPGLIARALAAGEWRPPAGNIPADPTVAAARAELERDLAAAERELTRLRTLCAKKDELITSIERVLESPTTKLQIKAPFVRLLIAQYHDRRFAGASTRPVPLWQEQFSEMMGGADPATVKTWIQTIGAENLATVIKEPTGRTVRLPRGGTVPLERYAIQLGPDPDRAPVSLATWRELMCKPTAAARRKERKQYERRCADHPDADLCRDWKCSRCGKLVYQDTVPPRAPLSANFSPSTLGKTANFSPTPGAVPPRLSSAELVALPPAPAQPAPAGAANFSPTAACACGTLLARGQDCARCNDRACLECGELTGSALRQFCPGRCRSANFSPTPYPKPPPEVLRDYGAAAGGA